MSGDAAVLLMAYGSPDSPDEVAPYYTHIRGGKTPSPEKIEHLQHRYAQVGGRTPLLRITEEVRAGLEQELARAGTPQRVYIGMKHWHPYIADTMEKMAQDGVRSIRAIALAPHYSRISIGGYRKALEEGNHKLGDPFSIEMVERWHHHPRFVALLASLVRDAVEQFSETDRASLVTVFTAHSLPERIRQWDDPYERELAASADAVARTAGVARWEVAWQSAGATGEPWIGPDILDVLGTLADRGVRAVLQVPIGFVSEHLEILFDIDIEAANRARELGLSFRRTELPNASPALIQTLASLARDPDWVAHEAVGVTG